MSGLQHRMILKRLYADRNHATAIIGPIGVVVWRGEATLEAVNRVRQMGLMALSQSPEGVGLIGVVERSAKVPNAESRKLSAHVNDELASLGAVGLAAVIPAEGFAGAWFRGAVTGLTLLARNRYPFRAYKTSAEACSWLAGMLEGSPLNWRVAAEAIDTFRKEYQDVWAAAPQGLLESNSSSSELA